MVPAGAVPTPHDQLARQLGFIRTSTRAFDEGHLDEAVRIATSIRVILHQTRSSTSLLEQLGCTDVPLLTTTRAPLLHPLGQNEWDRAFGFKVDGAGMFSINGANSYYGPKLAGGSCAEELGAPDWWRQVMFALDSATVFTRRDIVLGAANQDGGAHVDPAMEAKYARMAYLQEHGVLVGKSAEGEARVPLYGYHLIALRQIGHEILNSDRLVALAGSA